MDLHQISMVLSNHELPEALRHSILDGIKQLQIESTINTLIEEPVSLLQTQDPPSEYSSETLVLFDENTDTHPNQEPSLPTLGEFDDLGELGVGGMGEVRLVRDRKLNRRLAMKIIHARVLNHSSSAVRFIEEAQVCAQLQHPNIVPIHELGVLPDGRLFFTMKEVKGQSLSDVIQAVHTKVVDGQFQASGTGWTFRGLIEVFRQVCQAIAYAHSKGVLHRDLKPENIMLGEFGEVHVVDWGIAKVLGRTDRASEDGDFDLVSTDRQLHGGYRTQMGQVAGTPSYMSPEQARGEIDLLDSQSDVYSLGAILYEILSGRPPFLGSSMLEVLEQVRTGPPVSIETRPEDKLDLEQENEAVEVLNVPKFLVTACEKAMSRQKEDRYPSAAALASDISAWLEGAKRRDEALIIFRESIELEKEHAFLKAEGKRLLEEAEAGLKEVPLWAGEAEKLSWWEIEQLGVEKLLQAKRLSTLAKQKMQASLTHKRDLQEAHTELIERYRKGHEEAELKRDTVKAEKYAHRLKTHALELPTRSEVRARTLHYLKGIGALSLYTKQEGVRARLEKFVPHCKRLVPAFVADLGICPIVKHSLELGSYVIRLQKEGHHEVVYPVFIGRGEHWDGCDPEGKIRAIRLPKLGEIKQNESFVAAGWFQCGGDLEAYKCFSKRRVWVDDFIIQSFQVSNHQYIEFLNHLIETGQGDDALKYSPKDKGRKDRVEIYGRDKSTGRFHLAPDLEGDLWQDDWPVHMLDWFSIAAYSDWVSQKSGLTWSVPDEYQWEKAARGTDGRWYPWGNEFDPSYACMIDSHPNRPLPQSIYSFPIDCSVYGVRGMAGNTADWTSSPEGLPEDERFAEGMRAYRGGTWSSNQRYTRVAFRLSVEEFVRFGNLGFRLCRPYFNEA